MMKRAIEITVLVILLGVAAYMAYRSTKEGMLYTVPSQIGYATLDSTTSMGPPVQYKKCLCNQQGAAMYPAYDALGTRLFRDTSEWDYKGDKNYNEKYFSAVI